MLRGDVQVGRQGGAVCAPFLGCARTHHTGVKQMTLSPRFGSTKDVKYACRTVLRARIIYILWGVELLGTRFLVGMSSLAWAVMLLWPATYPLFPTLEQIKLGHGRTLYSIMALIMPDWQWAALFALQGVVTLFAVLYNVRTRLVLWIEGILGCLLWTTATISCFVSHFRSWDTYSPPAAMAAELMLTIGAWWVLVRYKVEGDGH